MHEKSYPFMVKMKNEWDFCAFLNLLQVHFVTIIFLYKNSRNSSLKKKIVKSKDNFVLFILRGFWIILVRKFKSDIFVYNVRWTDILAPFSIFCSSPVTRNCINFHRNLCALCKTEESRRSQKGLIERDTHCRFFFSYVSVLLFFTTEEAFDYFWKVKELSRCDH